MKTRLDLEQWHFTAILAIMVPFWHRSKKRFPVDSGSLCPANSMKSLVF